MRAVQSALLVVQRRQPGSPPTASIDYAPLGFLSLLHGAETRRSRFHCPMEPWVKSRVPAATAVRSGSPGKTPCSGGFSTATHGPLLTTCSLGPRADVTFCSTPLSPRNLSFSPFASYPCPQLHLHPGGVISFSLRFGIRIAWPKQEPPVCAQ
jgi:hypothetical protein